jgi:hypothetical protein
MLYLKVQSKLLFVRVDNAHDSLAGEEQISDEHLDKLLERQGRDCLYVEPSKDLLKVTE